MSTTRVLPPQFQERFQALLGDEYERFITCLAQPATSFVRVNTLKLKLQRGIDRLTALGIAATPLPWFTAGFSVSGNYAKLPFTRDYALGHFYIQEGGSMIPPVVLDPLPAHHVLDLCAAPGSKTTQIAQMMNNQGVLIAIDRSLRRLTGLGHNIQVCGVSNAIVLQKDGRYLAQQAPFKVDRVLVDAPCTASGQLLSKAPQISQPDLRRIHGLQAVQKGLLSSGFQLLKPEGFIVYATCSLHPEENEMVVNHLLTKFSEATIVQPKIHGLNHHLGLLHWEGHDFHESIRRCLRVYPHDNDTDGFFIALIRRQAG